MHLSHANVVLQLGPDHGTIEEYRYIVMNYLAAACEIYARSDQHPVRCRFLVDHINSLVEIIESLPTGGGEP